MYGDKEFDGVGYPTPSSIPVEQSFRTVTLPADAAWQGVFMGLVETLLDENNWQQFEGGITREEAAAVWADIVQSLYVSAVEGPCCPIFQTDPATGLPEVSYDGGLTFEKFPQGAYDPDETTPYAPAPAPLNKGSEDADKCQAASNAALVLAQFWHDTIATFAADLGNTLLQINKFLFEINQTLYRLVYPQEAQITKAIGLSEFPWPDYYDTPTLSDEQISGITCLLLANSSYSSGVVTFDYGAVYDGLPDAVGGVNPGIALQLLLAYVQSPGLNASGNVTATTSPDCSECGWTHVFDFTIGELGWTASPNAGSWSGGWINGYFVFPDGNSYRNLLITSPEVEETAITKIVMEFDRTPGDCQSPGDTTTGFYSATDPIVYVTGCDFVSSPYEWTGSATVTKITAVLLAGENVAHDPGGSSKITKITVSGEGTDPWL